MTAPAPPASKGQSKGYQYGPASGAPPGPAHDGQILQGTVISYDPAKGYGFLKCPSVEADCYFKGQGHPITKGMSLQFKLKLLEDGRPQAHEVSPAPPPRASWPQYGPAGKGAGKGAMAGPAQDGQRLQGSVVSYSSAKGWGFLRCPS